MDADEWVQRPIPWGFLRVVQVLEYPADLGRLGIQFILAFPTGLAVGACLHAF